MLRMFYFLLITPDQLSSLNQRIQVGDKKKVRFFQDVGNGQVASPDGPRNLKRHMEFNPR